MQVTNKTIAIGICAAFALGASTRYLFPATKTVENIVTKDHVVTVVKQIKNKDGTTETDTTTTEDKNTTDNKVAIVAIRAISNWHVGAGANIGLNLQPSYSVQVDRRILGPVFVGISGDTIGRVGAHLSVEF